MDVDKDILISNVLIKPVIWDKRLKGHANRNLVDKAWQEIAVEMDVEDDGVLRKKWKYLRDQFAVEVGKNPPPGSGDLPESKWPYFKSLMFLLGIVKPRPSSSNLRGNNSSQQQELVANIHDQNETEPEGAQVQDTDSQVSIVEMDDTSRSNSPSSEKVRKRKLSDGNAKYNQQLLSLEGKKASLLERVVSECIGSADNDDALFFRSLLPHVSNIPQHLKMRFRNRVQLLVDEFAYGSYRGIQSSHFNSQPIQHYSPEYTLTGSTHTDNNNSSISRTPEQSGNVHEEQPIFSEKNC